MSLFNDNRGRLPESDMHGAYIIAAVREGMAPFRMKMIQAWVDYDIDYHEYRILGSAVLMSGYTINYTRRINAWKLEENLDGEVRKTAEEFIQAFRNREDHAVAPLISLGEN